MEVTIEKIVIKKDERGVVFEPLTGEEISEQINLLVAFNSLEYYQDNPDVIEDILI